MCLSDKIDQTTTHHLSFSDQKVNGSIGVMLFTAPIRFYRKFISPLKPPTCRFTPTCSKYALDAYQQLGVFRGTWYTLTRLLKCHPWHLGGYDPVIPHEKNTPKT